MNTDFYNNFDINFETACDLIEQTFTHEQIIAYLQYGSIAEKQISAIMLSNINNKAEATILIDNLVGCDGKIREAVAFKIKQLLYENKNIEMFLFPEVFAKATVDINANICRTVLDSVEILKNNDYFKEKYLNIVLGFVDETFIELDRFIFRDKKYVINKQLFKLYWCLEALKLFINDIDQDVLFKILDRASQEKEYTIREKVAQIIVKIPHEKFVNIKEKLLNDENYYVIEAMKNLSH